MGLKNKFEGKIAVALTVALAACGGDPVGPDGSGQAQGLITDVPAAAPAFTGTLSADAMVSVSTDSATWVDIGSANAVTVVLQSATDTTNVSVLQTIAGDSYSYVRLTLTNALITAAAGSKFANITLAADSTLVLGGADSTLVIDRMVTAFSVNDSTAAVVHFELDSQAFVNKAAVQAALVDDVDAEPAVTVVVN